MFASALIVFREVLEAALVISIVAAATRMVPRRTLWIAAGLAAGLIGALAVALSAEQIAAALEGAGQEIFNAAVLFTAVVMLGWHNIWMQRHGRELAAEMNAVGAAVSSGARPLYAVAVAVGLAVLREGSEVVLFLYGIMSGGASAQDVALGGLLGIALGGAAGWALYAGLARLSTRHLFAATSWMILLLAAGMAASGAKFLAQAGLLPQLGARLWDTSWLLSEQTVLGQVLHVLVGYVARPSGIQLAFYAATILVIGGLMLALDPRRRGRALRAAGGAAAALAIATAAQPHDAQAQYKVYTPAIEKGELEFEYRGSTSFDADRAKDDGGKHLFGVGYGITDWWFAEVYGEWAKEPAGDLVFDAFEFESRFRFTEPGEAWADLGLMVEFERTDAYGDPDQLSVSLLAAKDFGRFSAAYNLTFTRELGSFASHDLMMGQAFQLRYRMNRYFEPGFEIYSGFGPIGDLPRWAEQEHRAGPVVEGSVALGDSGAKLRYNAGYLFGLTRETEDGALKATLELEIAL